MKTNFYEPAGTSAEDSSLMGQKNADLEHELSSTENCWCTSIFILFEAKKNSNLIKLPVMIKVNFSRNLIYSELLESKTVNKSIKCRIVLRLLLRAQIKLDCFQQVFFLFQTRSFFNMIKNFQLLLFQYTFRLGTNLQLYIHSLWN